MSQGQIAYLILLKEIQHLYKMYYVFIFKKCKVYHKHMNIATNSHDEQKYHQVNTVKKYWH